MTKNEIIAHYKDFFDYHAKGIALDEDDHLNLDWAEALVEKCMIPVVVQQRELLVAFHRTLVDEFTQEHEYYTREQIVDDFLESHQ